MRAVAHTTTDLRCPTDLVMGTKTPKREKFLTPTKSGTRAQIRIHGVLHRKHFKRGTEPLTIKQWLLAQEIKYRKAQNASGQFRADAVSYLKAVAAMPTYTERQGHIEEWITVFGDTLRSAITSDQIRAQLHAWKAAGKAASTVNHRRTALMHLYRVLDGRSGANPVKDVPKFREPSPLARTVPSAMMVKILGKLSGKTKARAHVLAYTGITHAQLEQIQSDHVDPKARTVMVPGRRKGAGSATSVRQLTTKGLKAFALMERHQAWGEFDRFNFRRALRAACTAAGVDPPIRPYDLRHYFGSELYRRSGDIRAVQILMGHSTPTLTHRYTLGAVDPRVAAAVKTWR